jgi:hypothetical protein
MHMRRGTAVVLAALMMVMGALPVLANDRLADERPAVTATDRPVRDRPARDVPVDREVDRPAEPDVAQVGGTAVDGPVDLPAPSVAVPPSDRPSDPVIDRPADREIDRYRCVDVVNDRRCIDDRHPHVNVRHLIQRLIEAGEWEKLFRLLHRLGII